MQFELTGFCPEVYPDNDGRHDGKLPFIAWVEWPPLLREAVETLGYSVAAGAKLCPTSRGFYVMTRDSQIEMARHFGIPARTNLTLIWCEHMGRIIE